jgi:hypothetical protein
LCFCVSSFHGSRNPKFSPVNCFTNPLESEKPTVHLPPGEPNPFCRRDLELLLIALCLPGVAATVCCQQYLPSGSEAQREQGNPFGRFPAHIFHGNGPSPRKWRNRVFRLCSSVFMLFLSFAPRPGLPSLFIRWGFDRHGVIVSFLLLQVLQVLRNCCATGFVCCCTPFRVQHATPPTIAPEALMQHLTAF